MRSEKFAWAFTITILLLFLSISPVFAQSSYVLPYPSFMPGNIFYKPHLVLGKILSFWSFGDFAQFKYNLRQSDKYLVEAKTLFEYNQYLLAADALKKSDEYFKKIPLLLEAAKKKGKDIEEKTTLLTEAAQKHQEVLEKLMLVLPAEFSWQPEKREGTVIEIKSSLEGALKIRRQVVNEVNLFQ